MATCGVRQRLGWCGALVLALVWTATPIRLAAQAMAPVTVMTYNIRYGTADDGDNAWPHRRDDVVATIRAHAPHLIGLQEALRFQLDELAAALPGYREVGVGRDDGVTAGEYAAILVDTTRFLVRDEGTTWLSDTPDVPGSTSWGNSIPRITTWALLEDRASGMQFFHFNLHLDHISQPSRERSVGFVLDEYSRRRAALIARAAHDAEFTGAPASPRLMVTGDFNVGEQNPAYLIVRNRGLQSAYRTVHPDAVDVATFTGFRTDYDPRGDKIDHIMLGPGWTVDQADIDRTRFGDHWASDHFAVWAVIH